MLLYSVIAVEIGGNPAGQLFFSQTTVKSPRIMTAIISYTENGQCPQSETSVDSDIEDINPPVVFVQTPVTVEAAYDPRRIPAKAAWFISFFSQTTNTWGGGGYDDVCAGRLPCSRSLRKWRWRNQFVASLTMAAFAKRPQKLVHLGQRHPVGSIQAISLRAKYPVGLLKLSQGCFLLSKDPRCHHLG
ncbi:hypothetical protein IF1G_10182 [Cordyceps javanica]|uniref:Uncharacterized protein n=1 Tax=Cordyceps javanica TaxID=43265 RepID=A0A545UPB5_9HYPO|nr:hypothetical protein IF1G_10182 [Cordyceps javanica]